jgi:predicted molibdopterin-dependent oxidoreductase YjgC
VPNLGPGYAAVTGAPGMTTNQMLAAAAGGKLDALLIVGANPALTFPDGDLARRALEKVPFLAVADQVMTETASYADVVFAAASFAEKRGHVTNLEGRRQAFAAAIESPIQVRDDAQLIAALAGALGRADAASADPETLFAQLALAEAGAQASRTQAAGLPRPSADLPPAPADARDGAFTVIPVPHLYAGGGGVAIDPGTAAMRPDPYAVFHPDDARLVGIADGDRVTLTGKGGSIEVATRIAHNVPQGFALVLAGVPEAPDNKLLDESGFGRATAIRADVTAQASA